jgi:hypothetical protein
MFREMIIPDIENKTQKREITESDALPRVSSVPCTSRVQGYISRKMIIPHTAARNIRKTLLRTSAQCQSTSRKLGYIFRKKTISNTISEKYQKDVTSYVSSVPKHFAGTREHIS